MEFFFVRLIENEFLKNYFHETLRKFYSSLNFLHTETKQVSFERDKHTA